MLVNIGTNQRFFAELRMTSKAADGLRYNLYDWIIHSDSPRRCTAWKSGCQPDSARKLPACRFSTCWHYVYRDGELACHPTAHALVNAAADLIGSQCCRSCCTKRGLIQGVQHIKDAPS